MCVRRFRRGAWGGGASPARLRVSPRSHGKQSRSIPEQVRINAILSLFSPSTIAFRLLFKALAALRYAPYYVITAQIMPISVMRVCQCGAEFGFLLGVVVWWMERLVPATHPKKKT